MNGKRIVNLRAALAGVALAVCATPGPSVAQSSYYEHRSGPAYGPSSDPYYAQPGDPAYSDYRYRSANAATRHGTVEAVEIEKQRQRRGETQRISVRMDDGTSRVFAQDVPELRAGDRVRVAKDGHLELA